MAAFARRVAAFAREHCGLEPGAAVVVGVSGGLDSTALLCTLAALGYACTAAHVNHGLRAAADAEAASAGELAARVGVPFHLVRVAVGPGNRLAAARAARYDALGDAARAAGADVVAVGHTASDQAETVLMRIARGTGLHGLGAMAPVRELEPGLRLVRPLLRMTRADVLAEALAQGWTWTEDPSNARLDRARTLVRHAALTLLDDVGGGQGVRHLAALADEARSAALAGGGAGLQLAGTPDARGGRLRLDALRRLSPDAARAVVAEAIRVWARPESVSRAAVADVLALVDAAPGRRASLGPAMAWRDREAVRIVRAHGHPAAPVAVGPGTTRTPWGTLVREPLGYAPAAFASDRNVSVVDADRAGEGLVVRPWAAGERIDALGLPRPALVSDLLAAARIEPSDKAQWPVVACGHAPGWVVGVRLAARWAVSPRTRRAERWLWTPAAGPGGPPPAGPLA